MATHSKIGSAPLEEKDEHYGELFAPQKPCREHLLWPNGKAGLDFGLDFY